MTINKLSDKFYSFLWSNEVLGETTPKINGIIICGWNDGGCRSLMRAIKLWLGEAAETYQIVTDENIHHSNHALCKVGSYFIDGYGIHSENEKKKIWKEEEGLDPIILRPFDFSTEPDDGGEEPFYYEEYFIQKLKDLLEHSFEKETFIKALIEGDGNDAYK